MRIAVVGGGAAGLMTVALIDMPCDITIYDRDSEVGKKILVTGNGRCNLANEHLDKEAYNEPDFVDKFISRYSIDRVLDKWHDMGLHTTTDSEGRVYPSTFSAKSVRDVLLNNIHNAKYVLNTSVTQIIKRGDKIEVHTDNGVEEYDKVIIATGGGTHILDLPYRVGAYSLCPIETDKANLGNADGVRVKANVTLSIEGNAVYSERGEVLFRKYGLSGIAIMNCSAYIARRGECRGTTISLDLMPDISADTLKRDIIRRIDRNATVEQVFVGLLVRQVASIVIKAIGLRPEDKSSCINVDKLTHLLKDLPYIVRGLRAEGQVVSGGYSIHNVADNLELKDMSGIYLVGEALDVDGLCGGYNLSWAWLSAMAVAEDINAKR